MGRILTLYAILMGVLPLCAQMDRDPGHVYKPPTQMDEVEGAQALEDFRNQRLSGDFSFLFELRHMPRRGRSTSYTGQMIGTWEEGYPRFRLKMHDASADTGAPDSVNLLLLNGEEPTAYITEVLGGFDSTGGPEDTNDPTLAVGVKQLEGQELYEPIFPGMVYTPFEVMMPFIYWEDYEYLGKERSKSRNVHRYIMIAPEDVRKASPEIASVRIAIDSEFRALIKAEILNETADVLKTFKINRFKKVGEEYIVKEIDLLDEATRDKTRFMVKAAALNVSIDSGFFAPDSLVGLMPRLEGSFYQQTD